MFGSACSILVCQDAHWLCLLAIRKLTYLRWERSETTMALRMVLTMWCIGSSRIFEMHFVEAVLMSEPWLLFHRLGTSTDRPGGSSETRTWVKQNDTPVSLFIAAYCDGLLSAGRQLIQVYRTWVGRAWFVEGVWLIGGVWLIACLKEAVWLIVHVW